MVAAQEALNALVLSNDPDLDIEDREYFVGKAAVYALLEIARSIRVLAEVHAMADGVVMPKD